MSAAAIFSELEQAYADRLALAASQGRPVVGYVGNTVPVELIVAAGCVPLRIAPTQGDTPHADRFVESMLDADVHRIVELYCTGALDGLQMLVIPRSTEAQHKLYLCLREMKRGGLVTGGPDLWLYDILHTQRDSSHAYGLTRTQALRDALVALSGVPCDDDALGAAIRAGNRTRGLLQRVHERRWTSPCSGRQALIATGALRFMAPESGAEALAHWLDVCEPLAVSPGPRLLVRGVPLDHDVLHTLVESFGARIVAEDDDWGARAAGPLIDESLPPLQAVFEHCWRDVPCVRVHPGRDAWFQAAIARPEVDGVIFYLPAPDDVHGWSYPADHALADSLGLPSLLLRRDARDGDDARIAVAAFIASLAAR